MPPFILQMMVMHTSEEINKAAMDYARTYARRRCGDFGESCNMCEYAARGDCDYRELRKAYIAGALSMADKGGAK